MGKTNQKHTLSLVFQGFVFQVLGHQSSVLQDHAEAYQKSCQTSKMERSAKIVNSLKSLIFFANRSILDVWQGSEYASAMYNHVQLTPPLSCQV